MTGGFADTSRAAPAGMAEFQVGPRADVDLLVAVLDQIVYLLDTTGQVPSTVDIAAADGGLDVRLGMAGPDGVEQVGAVPKAVSLHELRFARDVFGWSCGVTLDV
jgi:SHS2 domain-containing protein